MGNICGTAPAVKETVVPPVQQQHQQQAAVDLRIQIPASVRQRTYRTTDGEPLMFSSRTEAAPHVVVHTTTVAAPVAAAAAAVTTTAPPAATIRDLGLVSSKDKKAREEAEAMFLSKELELKAQLAKHKAAIEDLLRATGATPSEYDLVRMQAAQRLQDQTEAQLAALATDYATHQGSLQTVDMAKFKAALIKTTAHTFPEKKVAKAEKEHDKLVTRADNQTDAVVQAKEFTDEVVDVAKKTADPLSPEDEERLKARALAAFGKRASAVPAAVSPVVQQQQQFHTGAAIATVAAATGRSFTSRTGVQSTVYSRIGEEDEEDYAERTRVGRRDTHRSRFSVPEDDEVLTA